MDVDALVADSDRWESGELGCDEAHAVVVPEAAEALDEALQLHAISIRLQRGLIDALKSIADHHGIGYQPMVRDLLIRFAKAELKIIAEQIHQQMADLPVDADDGPASKHFDRAA